jgi:hypothetical protein
MTVTSGKEWRKERESVELTFPGGFTAAIRPVTSELLFKLGRIPDALTPLVINSINGSGTFDLDTDKPENFQAFLKLLDGIAETAFVSPKIVKEPAADDEISIDDLAFADKFFLMQFLNQPSSVLREFRAKQIRDVESVDAGAGHESAPVRTAEPESVGG